ncbi:hypothetical protein V1522DRAFT_414649 [Lipomyces starkeyi]
MAYHHHSRSYSASRRASSGMTWAGHSHQPSIPENEVLTSPTDSFRPTFESPNGASQHSPQKESTEYDRSVEMLVQNWMASNTSPALVPAAPTCDAIEAPQPTQAGDTNPNLSSISTAAKPEITIVSGHSPTPELNHSAPSFRSLVVWGNRKVVTNIPHELISEPTLLSTTELREYERRVHEWAVRNYNLISNQFHSSYDARAFYNALTCGKATVRIPDEKAWKAHVEFLREQKLLALGVSSPVPSDTFSPPRAMTPSYYTMSPDMNAILSGYNALNIYTPQPVVANPNMYHQPSASSVPRATAQLPSTPLSATAPAFVPPPLNDDFATSGLKINCAQGYVEAPIDVAGAIPTANPGEQDMRSLSHHRRAVSDLNGVETGGFIRQPRDSKRIPIVDPDSKATNGPTQRKESTPVIDFDKAAANDTKTNRERPKEMFTPVVQNDTPANELPTAQLDDIVQRLTEHSPTAKKNSKSEGASVNDDDSDSVWSDSVVKAQRQRLVVEAVKRNTTIDDTALQALLTDALSKKLDPLEKLVGMLTDQLKNSRGQQPEGHASDADDEEDDYAEVKSIPRRRSRAQENDGATEEATCVSIGSLTSSLVSPAEMSFHDLTILELRAQLATSTSRNEALLSELEEARRARERADAIVSELTNKIVESERAYSSFRAKVETYAQEIEKLKEVAEQMKSKHAMELDEKALSIRRDTEREYLFAAKEQEMQKEQNKFLQEQVQLLNDKLKIAASDSERAVEKVQKEVDRELREKEDILNSRATELSWLRGLLDTRIEELDEQGRILKSSSGETIDRQTLQSAYTSNNSTFLAKLKFGTAMSLVSDDFVQLISTVSDSFVARGISHKDHRRRLSRQILLENIMPLNEHNSNVPSNPSRIGYSGGLKDLKLNRAATIHGSAADREEVRRRPFREI